VVNPAGMKGREAQLRLGRTRKNPYQPLGAQLRRNRRPFFQAQPCATAGNCQRNCGATIDNFRLNTKRNRRNHRPYRGGCAVAVSVAVALVADRNRSQSVGPGRSPEGGSPTFKMSPGGPVF
jgi:hypothetical protein